jgi:hypothetical protein
MRRLQCLIWCSMHLGVILAQPDRERRSRESCFIFASDFRRAALEPTRELSGARKKDVSAMNEGSLAPVVRRLSRRC